MTFSHFNNGVLDAPAMFSIAVLGETTQTDGNVVTGLKVFRTGTFPDSRGRVNTWTRDILKLLEQNFNQLIATVLPNIPVREDHSPSMKDVKGYYRKVYVDPTNPDFLLADIEFTDPVALEKWNNKTYRNRSIEIGAYPTNSGEIIQPAVLGLAFVDIPAVEGLFRNPAAPQPAPGDQSPAADNNQGDPMSGTTTPPEGKPGTFAFRVAGNEVSDFAAVQAHISTIEAALAAANEKIAAGTQYTFKMAGVETTDFAKVQGHIDTLETFRKETMEHGRTSFVDGLATANKIGNPQIETFKALVLTMSPEQFEAFKTGFDAAPANNLFGKHETGNGGGNGDATADRIQVLRDTVQNHRFSGQMTEDEIKKSASYIELMKLTNEKG